MKLQKEPEKSNEGNDCLDRFFETAVQSYWPEVAEFACRRGLAALAYMTRHSLVAGEPQVQRELARST